jgi:hypothetical protein
MGKDKGKKESGGIINGFACREILEEMIEREIWRLKRREEKEDRFLGEVEKGSECLGRRKM